MKQRHIFLIIGLATSMLLGGCTEFNDQFEGLEEMVKPTNLVKYNYTLTNADYTSISRSALAKATNAADSAKAASIATNRYFTSTVQAADYVPYLLTTKYPYGDFGSTAMITYAFGNDKPSYLSDLTTVNILTTADYQNAWGSGTEYVNAFTPSLLPSEMLPVILAYNFPSATAGLHKFVEYNYSTEDATHQTTEVVYFKEDWSNHSYSTSAPYTVIGENGWISKDIIGTLNWQCRIFSNNLYAQVSSFNSNELNEAWLITPQIDLTYGISPQFTFDVTVGYWNATCLTVLVSEDFDGTTEGITSATWDDITSSYTFPETAGGYSSMTNAGTANLSAFSGKKVYIAFKYNGDSRPEADPLKTTTYQVDNIKISEVKVALYVANTEKQYVVYRYNGSNWVPADQSFLALQPADYATMGLTYISTANVPLYIPTFLRNKFPYALEGNVKIVVYKSGSNQTFSNATQFKFTNGDWVSQTFIDDRTEQFVFSVNGWLFDPTIIYKMVTSDYKLMVDYVLGNPEISIFAHPFYQNEEYYYGFSSRYSNVNFRLSYRNPYFTGDYTQPPTIDPELYNLSSNEDKVALLYERLKEGMMIFAQLRFPDAVPTISGIDVYYELTTYIYYPTGVASGYDYRKYIFKCTAAASGDNPPAFEYQDDYVVE